MACSHRLVPRTHQSPRRPQGKTPPRLVRRRLWLPGCVYTVTQAMHHGHARPSVIGDGVIRPIDTGHARPVGCAQILAWPAVFVVMCVSSMALGFKRGQSLLKAQ